MMLARLLGLLVHDPMFTATNALPYALHWLRRIDAGPPLRAARDIISGATRIRPLAIVSHHFMNHAELDTPLGRERLEHCVFHVPVADQLVSMCEVNATGIRDHYYEATRDDSSTVRALRLPPTRRETCRQRNNR